MCFDSQFGDKVCHCDGSVNELVPLHLMSQTRLGSALYIYPFYSAWDPLTRKIVVFPPQLNLSGNTLVGMSIAVSKAVPNPVMFTMKIN